MKREVEVDGSNPKTATREKNTGNSRRSRSRGSKEDRLSNLPVEVIHRVFSFLDASTAVQTSVLGKRWRYLWSSLPVLNFHDRFFEDSVDFQGFVDNFLSRRDASSNVDVLQFVCTDDLDDGFIVDSIIDYVIPMGIQVLSITAECIVEKLSRLSACQSLTTLKLADITTKSPKFDLVSLEKLYLFDCRFECAEEELDPFRGCPNLRCLILDNCQYYGKFERYTIYAPQLTDLSISFMRVDEMFDSDCVIELSTPKLTSFSYHDWDLYDFSINGDLPFLEKLDIYDVRSSVRSCTEATHLSLQLIELFEVMGSAKSVSLSPGIIKVLSMFPDLLDGRSSPFTRVRSFELNMDRASSFTIPTNVKAYLFGGSPGLDCY